MAQYITPANGGDVEDEENLQDLMPISKPALPKKFSLNKCCSMITILE